MGMFDNYKNINNQEHPDNKHIFLDSEEEDTIIRGGTCYHVFELPFRWSENVVDETGLVGVKLYNCVSYASGISKVLDKFQAKGDFEIIEYLTSEKSVIRVKILPEETLLFKNGRQTEAQLRLRLKSTGQSAMGDIIFSKKLPIKVIDTVQTLNDTTGTAQIEASIDELIKIV